MGRGGRGMTEAIYAVILDMGLEDGDGEGD